MCRLQVNRIRLCKSLIRAIALLVTCLAGVASGETGDPQMLIEVVAGNTYQQTSYAADGAAKERATLRVGPLVWQADGGAMVTVDAELYSAAGERISTRRSRWSCDSKGVGMLMNVIVLAGATAKGEIRLELGGPSLKYPTSPVVGATVDNGRFDLRLRKGGLAWIGARTRIALTGRRVQSVDDSPRERYTITGEVTTVTYLFGLPLKRQTLKTVETVQADVGLIRQDLIAKDGAYTSIELENTPTP